MEEYLTNGPLMSWSLCSHIERTDPVMAQGGFMYRRSVEGRRSVDSTRRSQELKVPGAPRRTSVDSPDEVYMPLTCTLSAPHPSSTFDPRACT